MENVKQPMIMMPIKQKHNGYIGIGVYTPYGEDEPILIGTKDGCNWQIIVQ